MPIDPIALEKAIKRAIPVSHMEIQDQSSGCGESYAIVLVSEVGTDSKLTMVLLTSANRPLKGKWH
jgi:stress-induced morphogen